MLKLKNMASLLMLLLLLLIISCSQSPKYKAEDIKEELIGIASRHPLVQELNLSNFKEITYKQLNASEIEELNNQVSYLGIPNSTKIYRLNMVLSNYQTLVILIDYGNKVPLHVFNELELNLIK